MSAYLGCYFKDRQRLDESTITNGRCTLHNARSLGTDFAVQARSLVEVRSGEIQLAQVPRVVHVIKERVHVRGGADA